MLVLITLIVKSAKKKTTANVGFDNLNCQIGKKKTTANVGFDNLNCQIGKTKRYRNLTIVVIM